MVACLVCRTFWRNAVPFLWADLSPIRGLWTLYEAFPEGSISSENIPSPYGVSYRQLAQPLTTEEAFHIGHLAGCIRHARIIASDDFIAEANSPLPSVQAIIDRKLLTNIRQIEFEELCAIASCNADSDTKQESILTMLERSLHFFLGSSTKRLTFWDSPPETHFLDFIHCVLQVLQGEGLELHTFQVGLDGPLSQFTANIRPTMFVETFNATFAFLERLSILEVIPDNYEMIPILLSAACRLPRLAQLDLQSPGSQAPMVPELPYWEDGFPELSTVRIRGMTDDVRNLLQSIPPSRLRTVEIETEDEKMAGLLDCLNKCSRITSITIREFGIRWDNFVSRVCMRQIVHLTLMAGYTNSTLTDDVITLLADAFDDLLDLEICEARYTRDCKVSVDSLQTLASRCPNLRTLALSVNFHPNPEALAQIPASLSPGHHRTYTMDSNIGSTHPSLEGLDLRYSRGLENGRVSRKLLAEYIVRMYPNLRMGRSKHQSYVWELAAGGPRLGEHDSDVDYYDELLGRPGDSTDSESDENKEQLPKAGRKFSSSLPENIAGRDWWATWKHVKHKLGDKFTIDYVPVITKLEGPREHSMWSF
ncbi:hypothetical protein FRC01_004357 [Tulasnella sp. 417]|nr:hypothetical protein FRC01_004357 [Tulasnella sp. 417]